MEAVLRNLHYPAAALGLLLAGCSSGGGGGVSATAAPTAIAPSTPQTSAGSGGPINLQGANSTVDYKAAALYGSALYPAPGTASVTLTTDASGNLKIISFNLPGFGLKDASPSVIPSSSITADLGNLVLIFRETFGFVSTQGYTLSQVAGPQTLSSSAFGLWGSGDVMGGGAGGFAFGNLTPANSMPPSGSATFNGTVIGLGTANNATATYALQGEAQINANFSNQSVTTRLTNLNTMNLSTNAKGSLPELAGTSTIAGNAYSGSIAGGGLTGTVTGNFYGSAAQETTGVWQASGGGSFWGGSYGAK